MLTAVIMAGGKGTRLANITKNEIPKSMVTFFSKPILEYQINNLKKYGVNNIIIIIGFLGNIIKDYFGDGNRFDVHIDYIEETTHLGTAGALYYLKQKDIGDNFILLFGDLMIDINWEKFINFHKKNDSLITLFSRPNTYPSDCDLLLVDNNVVLGIDSKHNSRDYDFHNVANSGIYIINHKILDKITSLVERDFESDIVVPEIYTKRVYSYYSSEYVMDAGTEERCKTIMNDIKSNTINCKNLSNKQKCIFLDRDGTINVNEGFIKYKNKIHLYQDTAEAIRKINNSEYICIVITNQPYIEKKEGTTYDSIDSINKHLETILVKEKAFYNALYYCPHRAGKDFNKENKEFHISCECRKPNIGLILKAQDKFNIDLSRSWFIGDTDRDVLTGKRAGMKTILVDNDSTYGKNELAVTPDFKTATLLDAINLIIK